MARLLTPPIGGSQAIRVDTGIDRIDQQAVQRWPVRPAPLKLALVLAAGGANWHADLVDGEMAQYLTDRTEALVELKGLADRRLRLLIGIEDDLPRWPAHIAHGHRLTELPAPRFGHPRFEHSRFENMEFGL